MNPNDTFSAKATIPSVSAAYAAEDAIGTKVEFPYAGGTKGGGLIADAVIIDKSNQAKELVLHLFDADFTATADNSPFTIAAADYGKYIGHIVFSASEYKAAGTAMVTCRADNPALGFISGNRTLYAQLACGAATGTWANNAIVVKLGILRD